MITDVAQATTSLSLLRLLRIADRNKGAPGAKIAKKDLRPVGKVLAF